MDRDGRTWTQRHPILTTGRRAAIAALLLGGGRASAPGAAFWRDVDLANGRFVVGRDKTDAGMREVDMLPLLREILTEHKAATEHAGPNDPVFVTSIGKAALAAQHSPRRRRRRGRARDQARRSARPTTTAVGITPHKLRHTFASILVAIGRAHLRDAATRAHDPAFTLRVYAHMRRSEDERERLKALVEGHVWAVNGRYDLDVAPQTESRTDSRPLESPAVWGCCAKPA